VELGRLDGLSSSASSVTGQLPHPTHTINQLVAIFRAQGLTMSHMVALSAAHTVGLAHCDKFSDRLYGSPADSTLNPTYAAFLRNECPSSGSSNPTVRMDQSTPAEFDNQYFKNLQDGGGLLASDQLLYTDSRTRPNVDAWASSSAAFSRAFVDAIVKLGRVGVKSGSQGNIRTQCDVFN
jgi:peroxidase